MELFKAQLRKLENSKDMYRIMHYSVVDKCLVTTFRKTWFVEKNNVKLISFIKFGRFQFDHNPMFITD